MSCSFSSFKSSGWFGGDYWCDKKDCSVNEDDYRRYCRDYNYGDCPIYKQSNSSGCFITTVVCDVLGYEDNNEILNNLRCFRDDVLQKDKKYYDVLNDYDSIGPYIADYIANDKNGVEVASIVYNNMVLPVNELIKKKEYDRAVSRYELIVMNLISFYRLNELYDILKEEKKKATDEMCEYEAFMAGHGKRRILARQDI